MAMAKKGQGISINVIVIAAIALLILVILSTLVIRSSRKINEGTQDCLAIQGNVCMDEVDYRANGNSCEDGFIRDTTKGCTESFSGEPRVCCIRL